MPIIQAIISPNAKSIIILQMSENSSFKFIITDAQNNDFTQDEEFMLFDIFAHEIEIAESSKLNSKDYNFSQHPLDEENIIGNFTLQIEREKIHDNKEQWIGYFEKGDKYLRATGQIIPKPEYESLPYDFYKK